MNISRFANPLTNRLQRIGKSISKEDFLQRVSDGTATQTQEFIGCLDIGWLEH